MKKFLLSSICFFLVLILCSTILWIHANSIKKDAYLLARLDKHEIFKNTQSPKVVFVGGSNIAFGIDCSQIADSIGIRCINMGLHAGQGMRFIMNDMDPFVKSMKKEEGNVIVLMPEFAHFFGEISKGGSTTLGEVFLVDPHSIEIMSIEQKYMALKGIPKQLTSAVMESMQKDAGFKYKRSYFDKEGDEIGHYNFAYDNGRTIIPPHILIQGELNSDFCKDFKRRVEEWGHYATVILLPETIYEGYIQDNKDKLQVLEDELKQLGIPYYTSIDAFTYSYEKIFMSPDHITGAAVADNSGRVGHLLKGIIEK